jgi:hypothetical protein
MSKEAIRTGWAKAIPLYDVTLPWYKFVTPKYAGRAGLENEAGRSSLEIALTKAHEGQHLMDFANHPQITYLIGRGTENYFPGSGLAKYWSEFRGYRAGGRIAGIEDIGVPLRSFNRAQKRGLAYGRDR